MNLAKAFMVCAAVLSVAACGVKEVAAPMPTKEAELSTLAPTKTPTAVLSGDYCTTAPNITEQLKNLDTIEAKFTQQNSSPKSLDELLRLGDDLVSFLRFPAGFDTVLLSGTTYVEAHISQGLSLGGGYFVTVSHGLIEPIVPVPNKDNSYSFTISPNRVLLVYTNDKKENIAVHVQNITAFPYGDMALVYLPSQDKGAMVAIRPSSTLKQGEKLYNITLTSNGLDKREGEVMKTSVTANDASTPYLIYSNQILTSISADDGDSGSPVFDRFGNLVGVLSVGASLNGKSVTTVASVDSLTSILVAQKLQLACPQGR